MSGNISLTSSGWHGTQMKPDMFEPVTAEWAGRAAMNAGWLFARQQQVVFADAWNHILVHETPDFTFEPVLRRRFWLNEVVGTFTLSFYASGITELVLAGTVKQGHGLGWTTLGTSAGTYTTDGAKLLTIHTDPNWHKEKGVDGTNFKDYAELLLMGRVPSGQNAILRMFTLSGLPRR